MLLKRKKEKQFCERKIVTLCEIKTAPFRNLCRVTESIIFEDNRYATSISFIPSSDTGGKRLKWNNGFWI